MDDSNLAQACPEHCLPSRLTRAELALHWRVSLRTIERLKTARIGPQPIRVGGRVLYRREDVLTFEQAQINRSRP